MTAPRWRAFEPWLQLVTAFAAATALVSGYGNAGAVVLVVMAVAWPPAVSWRPLAAVGVLRAYVLFAAVWLVLLVGYLQGMSWLGHAVAPQPMLQEMAALGLQQPRFVVLVLTIVVVGPVIEELLFRGYLFTALVRAMPSRAAQLLTAALFGLVHGLAYALPIGVLALLFGWLRQRHQALLPSVFAHMVHNFLTVLITVAWPGHLQWLYPQ